MPENGTPDKRSGERRMAGSPTWWAMKRWQEEDD